MYNRLKVKPSSLAYQLLLYDESLDPATPPKVWVLVSAWYGVVNTGNQASAAIEALVDLFEDQFPGAVLPLKKSRCVDDIAPGALSEREREAQINDIRDILEKTIPHTDSKVYALTLMGFVRTWQQLPEFSSSKLRLNSC